MKNSVSAKRLSFYFACILLVFTITIGIVFILIFRYQTIKTQEKLLVSRAEAIAENISEFYSSGSRMGVFSSYLRSINSIAGADAWVVDHNYDVITSNGNHHGMMGMGMEENSTQTKARELPENAEQVVDKAFKGEVNISDSFSGIVKEHTITVGVPVVSSYGHIVAVVLLHSPVTGIEDAIRQGVSILALSLVVGLILSFILSIFLSKIFTGPILLKEAEDIIRLEKNRKDFVANVAHELKTPLTIVKSSLENLNTKELITPDDIKLHNQQSLNEIDHLERLVGDLLDLSKLQNPDFSMELSEVHMNDLVSDVLRSSRRLAAQKNINIVCEGTPNFTILGDYVRLRQLFIIIVDNAIKFSDPGSEIEIVSKGFNITVCDHGQGITEDDLPNIFDRFYRSNINTNKTGTGLGLAICKEIADRHDISISVVSDIGKGTCFSFDFSRADISDN